MVFQVQIKYQKNSSTIQGIQVLLATLGWPDTACITLASAKTSITDVFSIEIDFIASVS